MAGMAGLEPATSRLTAGRSYQSELHTNNGALFQNRTEVSALQVRCIAINAYKAWQRM